MQVNFEAYEKAFNKAKKIYESTLTAQDVWTEILEDKRKAKVANALASIQKRKERGTFAKVKPSKVDWEKATEMRHQHIKIKDIAHHFGVLPTYISKQFKKRGIK